MKNKYVVRLATSGLMAALIILLTAIVKIPVPMAGGGYIHLGDAAIFMTTAVLAGPFAIPVAGLASAAADLLAGYPSYALGTFVIKALVALVSLCFIRKSSVMRAVGFSLAGAVMIGGYYAYEAFILGYGAAGALAEIPWNIIQAVAGVVIAFPLLAIVERVPVMRDLREWSGWEG